MAISKKGNFDYSGGFPLNAGDRYYSQDLGRDFNFGLDNTALQFMDLYGLTKGIISGWIITAGTTDALNISAGIGYAPFQVTMPTTPWSIPPSTVTESITLMRVVSATLTNWTLVGSGATGNGSTPNYLKIAFAWAGADTRTRAKKAGSYSYNQTPSYTLTCNATPPTAYEICLMEILWNSSTHAITIQNTGVANSRSACLVPIRATGSNDDQNIQGTINQLSLAGGGVCQISAGTFDIQNYILLKSNIIFKGYGANSVLSKGLITQAQTIYILNSVSNSVISDMLLNGNYLATATGSYISGISSQDNTERGVFVSNVIVKNYSGGNATIPIYGFYIITNAINCQSTGHINGSAGSEADGYYGCKNVVNCNGSWNIMLEY